MTDIERIQTPQLADFNILLARNEYPNGNSRTQQPLNGRSIFYSDHDHDINKIRIFPIDTSAGYMIFPNDTSAGYMIFIKVNIMIFCFFIGLL